MKKIGVVTALAAVALAAVPAGAAVQQPAQAQAGLRQFEGTVVSVNREARRFRLRDTERGTVRIRVTRNTRFERIDGLAGLRVGMNRVEAVVRRSNGRWVALEVERSGGGGEHGGGNGGGGGGSGPGG
jgi:hypothetical protein